MTIATNVTFYVALDVLLDTRFGCLVTHYGSKTLDMTKDYFVREYERFGDLRSKEFLALYKKRDKKVLQNSVVTNFISILSDFIEDAEYKSTYSPEITIPRIVVNIFPYDLTEEEQKAIKVAMLVKLKKQVDISFVDIDTKKLTPQFVEKNYQIMAMYDYNTWLEQQALLGNVEKNPIRNVTLYAPKIYFDDTLNPEDFKKFRKGRTVYDTIEVMTSMFINLQLIDIAYFNFLVPSMAKMKMAEPPSS